MRFANDLFNGVYAMFLCIFSHFFIKAYVVGTHLNCIDKLMQYKWVSMTYAYAYRDMCDNKVKYSIQKSLDILLISP